MGGDAWNRPPGRRTKQETAITSGDERINDYTGREDGRHAWSNVRTAAAYHRWNAYHWLKQYSHEPGNKKRRIHYEAVGRYNRYNMDIYMERRHGIQERRQQSVAPKRRERHDKPMKGTESRVRESDEEKR